jgi:hypothetical protein
MDIGKERYRHQGTEQTPTLFDQLTCHGIRKSDRFYAIRLVR